MDRRYQKKDDMISIVGQAHPWLALQKTWKAEAWAAPLHFYGR